MRKTLLALFIAGFMCACSGSGGGASTRLIRVGAPLFLGWRYLIL